MQQQLIEKLKNYFTNNNIKVTRIPSKKALEIQHAFILGAQAAGADISPAITICILSGRLITDL